MVSMVGFYEILVFVIYFDLRKNLQINNRYFLWKNPKGGWGAQTDFLKFPKEN